MIVFYGKGSYGKTSLVVSFFYHLQMKEKKPIIIHFKQNNLFKYLNIKEVYTVKGERKNRQSYFAFIKKHYTDILIDADFDHQCKEDIDILKELFSFFPLNNTIVFPVQYSYISYVNYCLSVFLLKNELPEKVWRDTRVIIQPNNTKVNKDSINYVRAFEQAVIDYNGRVLPVNPFNPLFPNLSFNKSTISLNLPLKPFLIHIYNISV